ncbi:glycoside hydrolase family 3 N-terminal domain-containing protein [Streptomyces sp. NPDC007920]|uniref:glycoside hydrolase family 3 N-terminal domain-containing protein n=1 Tax=Streptomyces sp. NPDC007920 TaxID=3364794 RepID=UPI0036F15640
MLHSPTAAAGDGAVALRDQVELLVRPGRQCLVPGAAEALLRAEAGSGSGRIGKDTVTSAAGMRAVTRAASRDASPPPLLVSVNQEGGRLNALDWPQVAQLPGSMALGAAGDAALAQRAGAVIGGQLRAVGVTWNLAPVCDLAAWPSQSAVGTRAFASDPAQVARLAGAFVRGLQSAGVAATAKHFPGLGGVAVDPHHAAPVVDELPTGALLPFRAAVQAGAACVMVGSHTVRAIEDRPALASRRTIALLRDDLGFGGLVVSENLSIPAVHEPLGGLAHAAVAAVAAGVDLVMLDSEISRGHQTHPQRVAAVRRRGDVVQALVDAVEVGLIGRQRVAEAAARVLALHHRFGIGPGAALPDWAAANEEAHQVADQVAGESVTVVRGAHLLPLVLAPGAMLAVVRVPDVGQRRADSARHAPDLLPALLGAGYPVLSLPAGGDLPDNVGAVVVHGYDTRTGAGHRSGAAAEAARLARCHQVVQIAFGDPDDLAGSPADVLIAAYSPHQGSAATVSRVLSGHLRARGAVPVEGAGW